MALYRLQNDVNFVPQGGAVTLLKKGKLIDSALFNITALQAAGALLIPDGGAVTTTALAWQEQQSKGQDPQGSIAPGTIPAEVQGEVTSVSGTAPIASTGGANPVISIVPATDVVPGSMSAADKTKLDAISLPTVVGTPGLQTGAGPSFTVFGQTVNAAPSAALDTGYKPPANHAAAIGGGLIATDRTADKSISKNINAAVDNYGGLAVKGTPVVSGGTGDTATFAGPAALTITFGVSGTGTLTVTLNPPTGYVGTIDWVVSLSVSEN